MESSSNNQKDSSSKKMDNMNNKKKNNLQFPIFDNIMQNPIMETKNIPNNDKIKIPDNIQKPMMDNDLMKYPMMLNDNFQKETIQNIMNQHIMFMAQINRIYNNQNKIMNNQNMIMNNQDNINNALLDIINSINNFKLFNNDNHKILSQGSSNIRYKSMDYKNNKNGKTIVVLFRSIDGILTKVQCNLEDKASDVIRRYRKKTRKENFEEGDELFMFNGKKIKENKSLTQNGILNNSTIVVINLKEVKGAN